MTDRNYLSTINDRQKLSLENKLKLKCRSCRYAPPFSMALYTQPPKRLFD